MRYISQLQDLLSSLSYSYTLSGDEEPVRGERLVKITTSDGVFQSSIIITIDVVIVNNNPPQVTFAGSTNISFTEGATVPVSLGPVVVSDDDNNDVFLMESATVVLINGVDGVNESLIFDTEVVASLGITVSGK